MEKLLYVLLGFVLGLATFLINEWVKGTRKRAGLLEVLTWQIEAFKAVCEDVAAHKLYDSPPSPTGNAPLWRFGRAPPR
jgi:hypothetical protein